MSQPKFDIGEQVIVNITRLPVVSQIEIWIP